MKKIYLLLILLLTGFSAFSQAPQNDSCKKAFKLCYLSDVGGTQVNSNATDDGTFSCGGIITKGLWYHFEGYKGGSATITITNQSPGSVIKAEIFKDSCAGTAVAGTCLSSAPGANLNITINAAPNTSYYIVVGGNNIVFNININNNVTDAVTSQPSADLLIKNSGQSYNKNFAICANAKAPDDSITITNNTSYHGGSKIKYFLSIGDANAQKKRTLICPILGTPASCTYTDTTINIIKTMQTLGLTDSVDVCLYATNGCGVPSIPTQKCIRIFIQNLDAKFDILPFQKCGQDTVVDCAQGKVNFAIVPPMKPAVIKAKGPIPGVRDSAIVTTYKMYIRKPCGGVDSFAFSPSGTKYKQYFSYTVPANCYGQFVAKLQVISPGFCGPVWAYNAKGNLTAFQDTTSRDTTIKFTIYAPPKVAPEYSMTNASYTKKDTICSGVDAYIRLPRIAYSNPSLGWGTGKFRDSLIQIAGPAVTITKDPAAAGADSVFRISKIPVKNTYTTYTFRIRLKDANSCYQRSGCDTTATIVVKPAALVSAKIATPPDTAVCFNNPISLTAKDSLGVGPFDFHWYTTPSSPNVLPPYSASANPNNITSLPLQSSTTFRVYMTDQQGCFSDTAKVFVSVHPKPAPVASHSPVSICLGQNDTLQLVTTIANPSNYIYHWDTDDASITINNNTAQNTFAYPVKKPAKFWVDVIDYTIGSSCTGTDTIKDITPGLRPTLSSGPTTSFCQDASGVTVQPVVANFGNGTTFKWTYDNVHFSASGGATATPVFTPNVPVPSGTYTFTVVVRDPNMPRVCDSTLSFQVVANPTPTGKFTYTPASPTPICQGFPIHITSVASGSTFTSYRINSGTVSHNNFVDTSIVAVAPVTTVLIQEFIGGCEHDTTLNINVITNPQAPILNNPALSVCENTSAVYSVSSPNAGSIYHWILKNGKGSITASPVDSTSITVSWTPIADSVTVMTDTIIIYEQLSTGCKSISAKYAVRINPHPKRPVIFGNGGVCQGDVLPYKPLPTDGFPATYQWTLQNGKGTISPSSTSTSININWAAAGQDFLRVTETLNGCSSPTGVLVVDVLAAPAGNPTGPLIVCEDSALYSYSVPKQARATIYNWAVTPSTAASIVSGNGTNKINLRTNLGFSGTFDLSVSETDSAIICTGATNKITVSVSPRPVVSITNKAAINNKTYCVGTVVTLNLSSTGTVSFTTTGAGSLSGGPSVYSYTIAPGDTSPAGVTVTFTSTTAGCNTVTDKVTFFGKAAPSVTIVEDNNKPSPYTVCNNTQVGLSAKLVSNAGVGTLTYNWAASPPGGAFLPNATSPNVTYIPGPGYVGTVTVNLTVSNGICATAPIPPYKIIYKASPNANVLTPIGPICESNASNPLTVQLTGVPAGIVANWSVATGPGSIGLTSGIYTVGALTSGGKQQVQLNLTMVDPSGACPSKPIVVPPFDVYANPIAFAGDNSFSVTGKPILFCENGPPIQIKGSYAQKVDYFDTHTWAVWEEIDPVGVLDSSGAKFAPHPTLTNTNVQYTPSPLSPSGRYNIVLVVDNKVCPARRDTFKVDIIKPTIYVPHPNKTYCAGDTVKLNAVTAGPAPYAKVKWTTSGSGIFGAAGSSDDTLVNPIYTLAVTDVGAVTLTITLKTPCDTIFSQIVVNVEEKPDVSIVSPGPNPLICYGRSLNLVVSPDNVIKYNYVWTSTSSSDRASIPGKKGSIRVFPATDATYTLVVENKNKQGCSTTLPPMQVRVVPKPILTVPNRICKGFPITLKDTLPGYLDPYHGSINGGKWTSATGDNNNFTNGGTVLANSDVITYKPTAAEQASGSTELHFMMSNTVCLDTIVTTVQIVPTPTVTANKNNHNPGEKQDSLPLNTQYYPLAGDTASMYGGKAVWRRLDGSSGMFVPDSTAADAKYYPSDVDYNRGYFKLAYVVLNSCKDTSDVIRVKVKTIITPNVMSPNGDNVNDAFTVTGLPEGSRLKIFDRWGRLVYKSDDSGYKNDWKAEDVDAGTYYYVLTYKLGERKGFIQIFK